MRAEISFARFILQRGTNTNTAVLRINNRKLQVHVQQCAHFLAGILSVAGPSAPRGEVGPLLLLCAMPFIEGKCGSEGEVLRPGRGESVGLVSRGGGGGE